MTAHFGRTWRRGREWWWFFTMPLTYSVWWLPDGTKTRQVFFDEQLLAVRQYIGAGSR